MGAQSSSEVATGEQGIKKQAQTNIGLVTLASESQASGFNLLEIATCIIAVLIALYLLRWCCVKHQAKKMQRFRDALASVHVAPHMARLPVLQPPLQAAPPPAQLPAYPGLPTDRMQAMGAEIMSNYKPWKMSDQNLRKANSETLETIRTIITMWYKILKA